MKSEDVIGKSFLDDWGEEHIVVKELSRGGQGVVFTTKTEGFLLKFALDEKGEIIERMENPASFDKNKEVYETLSLLPLNSENHLALPVSYLTEYSGYVMRFMEKMTSLDVLQDPNTFKETGSVRVRLEVLRKLSSLLSLLHTKGLTYCDLSPDNIFITEDLTSKVINVYLIDCENIYSPETKGVKVFKPRYASPYLLKEENSYCRAEEDMFSFAVLAFETLSLCYPFNVEESVKEKEWWETTTTSDSNIFASYDTSLPYIFSDEENIKENETPIPHKYYLTKELQTLFHLMFTIGQENINKRPTASLFERALEGGKNLTYKCSNCGSSFIYTEEDKSCPFCDKNFGPRLILKNEKRKIVFVSEIKGENDEIKLGESLFVPFNPFFASYSAIKVEIEKDEIKIIKENEDIRLFITQNKKEGEVIKIITHLSLTSPITLVTQYKNGKQKTFNMTIEGRD